MELNEHKFRKSIQQLNDTVSYPAITRILNTKKFTSQIVDETIDLVCDFLIDGLQDAFEIRTSFSSLLLPIVSKLLNELDEYYGLYQRKIIAISIFAETNQQVLRFAVQHFNTNGASPFSEPVITGTPKKRAKMINCPESDLDIVETCLRFLKLDLDFFRRVWKWDEFIEKFHNQGCELQKYYCNQIIGLLFGMTTSQLAILNRNVPSNVVVETEAELPVKSSRSESIEEKPLEWNLNSDIITGIEGVFLPVFDKLNYQFYNEQNLTADPRKEKLEKEKLKLEVKSQDKFDKIIRVESTRINLRSLALGVSSGKAICLSGPVGCGKTSLVEYLARKVGRLPPKIEDFMEFLASKKETNKTPVAKGKKRKLRNNELEDPKKIQENVKKNTPRNGFLRIQLGDQTDSKVLLGQYRCTDVPGEFLWQPGVITQAVLNGYWLLLEDLDSATQDVCTVLTNLLENNFLSVPGFRENLKITPGFQLFVTLRTHKSSSGSSNSPYSLLEKHLYTINIMPLSRNELSEIICQNYPKLETVSKRIVDVFLTFSSGCHNAETENTEMDVTLSSSNEKKKPTKDEDTYEVLPFAQHISMASLTNSGRMVSTRDLLKLCKRSNPNFQVASSECAAVVFMNCVDLFCSHLPSGQVKTDLIISIGARLGIPESRCIHTANEYKPETVRMTSDDITVGRVTLSRNSKEEYEALKRLKLSDEPDDGIGQNISSKKTAPPLFSFTRISSCILERIAVAVNQNEPVLLVGETGVGKTSSIQYLAYQTNHKLLVVNMNNQSDVSDLIGGFKPVDVSFVIAPLRVEFEILFAKTFDVEKNEKFLNNVSVCFNRGDFAILVKLMFKIIPTGYKRLETQNANGNESTIERWHNLENKLTKLDHQLKNSINLSFAFIPGSLVNCIKNGDWVLLDEINLASTETLECLSTILEPDGSVILLERGDFVPIKRHPDFRIFSCMNPNTDVGKKDLPVGIRNRFTEFFLDELTSRSDLHIIVGDYLNNTGIQKPRISKAVTVYMDLRKLSQLELNDGLGNKPVFSLRTLCRALRICSKNLCGSIERNIYESFCLSFLTQLDPPSHERVIKLIEKELVSDAKKILSQQIPKPDGNQINFEGYWIEYGQKEPEECIEYILTASVKKNLRDLARIISIGKLPILLQGPTSAGKTSLIEYIARRSGNFCLRINNHEHTDLQEYIGTYMADVNGKLTFQEGVLVKAMRNGYWIILDELNLAPSDILEALNRVLDDNRELYIPETQVLVKAHPNFMLFATQNPPGLYGGRKTLSRAFKNRFIELHFSEIPKAELEFILEKRCRMAKSHAEKMVKTMSALQANRRSTTKNNFTLRDLFRWGNRYTIADKMLLENGQSDKNYDWNQHLVDEGYLVLSAKVRNSYETQIIVDALFQYFRKKVSVESLFTLNEHTSMVTKSILETITNYKGAQNVVWTFEMRRMAVLVSKSLDFNEPVLLVGPTGCGKTTVCQILAEIRKKELRILNCHMHTEGADFLGGLRPHRDNVDDEQKQLFEWSDGPLILSMVEGNFFLADEISLAEDSVLERLNCVLEPERTILLAEKGGVDENVVHGATKDSDFVIKASDGFQFLATMNPGGDFGKKELSPALRNRFTEIWCTAINSDEDLVRIAMNLMGNVYDQSLNANIAQIIVNTVKVLKRNVEKLNFSIRDILAWVNYITKNYSITDGSTSILSLNDAFLYGLQTLFLDALEMLPYENFDEIQDIRRKIINEMSKLIRKTLKTDFNSAIKIEEMQVESNKDKQKFGIHPFYLDINPNGNIKSNDFSFSAPTTKKNLFRVLSALSLNKAILLEGPPGVGKSSLIENIANAIGYSIVRINLCEHTDLADLFGTDLPAESKSLEIKEADEELQLGSFVWRDGPLLAALKAPNTWILLDELNLAPQSVLEGLNAILDHRGEVYIPELNKTFKLGQQTRIFAAQNPLRQGGGRKGLPQSFLNRFTKVYLRKLIKTDLLHVIEHNFGMLDEIAALRDYKLLDRMVTFSERLEEGMRNLEFGYKGGPYEANLRDVLRWCKLLTNGKTGFDVKLLQNDEKLFQDFLLVLFEKMKLVYCQRMRTESDVIAILRIFGDVFECNAAILNDEAQAVSMYWNDTDVFLSDVQWTREAVDNEFIDATHKKSIILSSQIEALKNVTECVLMEKPIILNGPSDCGKTKIIDTFCTIFNKNLYLDTIDDSVTGSFQQFDFNRMLENLWQSVEQILFKKLANLAANGTTSNDKCNMLNLFKLWRNYDCKTEKSVESSISELESFCKRVASVQAIFEALVPVTKKEVKAKVLQMQREVESWQKILEKSSNVLNTGGRFEWVDSVIVKSIKFGHFICLEHVNLASSAILDRLNPVMEPNGTLLISEKGVGENNEPEIISKHHNFRIFLTMDPKHGEISRAMRNRCIELSIPRENYSEDDLRKIIYIQGVHQLYLIQAVMNVHKAAKSLSEFSTFGVSQLMKMSFLVAQNMTMGLDDKKCLLISALEVYVRSSNVDLLGFGLSYYRDKLKEAIVEEIQKVEHRKDYVVYENLILKSDKLTTMKLVKLQAEPLLVLLRCLGENFPVGDVISDLSVNFKAIDLKEVDALPKYLLTFFYMISTFDDYELRQLYLDEMMNDNTLKMLNENLSKIVKEFSVKNMKVPWDSKMFQRLRPYQKHRLQPTDQYRITLALLLEMTLEKIVVEKSVKRSEVNVITYSRAVEKKALSDSIENTLVTGLYKLLTQFRAFVGDFLKKPNLTLDNMSFVKILLSLLWFNRVLCVSTEKLYKNNSVNTDLMDQLNLHFKWFSKHCVNAMISTAETNDDFVRIFQNIHNFILSHHHPLKLYKKIYVKDFTNFFPFYNENQLKTFTQTTALSDLVTAVPKMDRLFTFEEYRKRLMLMMSSSYDAWRKQFIQEVDSRLDTFEPFKSCWDDEMKSSDFIGELIERFEAINSRVSYDTLLKSEQKIEEFQNFLKNEDSVSLASYKFELEILPILEYFVLKAIQAAVKQQISINIEYLAEVQSIDSNGITVIAAMNDPRFDILRKISTSDLASKEFLKNHLTLMMQINSNVQRMIQQSLSVNNMLCRAFSNEETYTLETSKLFINGTLLTTNVLETLLGPNGRLRGTGLGEINQWKAMLRNLKKILWMNAEVNCDAFNLPNNNLQTQLERARKLLINVDAVKVNCMSIENENFSDFNNEFWLVINKLEELLEKSLDDEWKRSFLINSLSATIELNLISYLPLMDPVKKNQLKAKYLHEDLNHLERLLTSYKFMSIIMNYENLGKDTRNLMEAEIQIINEKLVKHSKKVALRPDDCIYSSLVKVINHFIASCCHPKNLLDLVTEIESVLQFEIDYKDVNKNRETQGVKSQIEELISKLDLWIANANKFENHSIKQFQAFYRDFVAPIECSITSLKSGFMGLRAFLKMKNDSILMKDSGIFWNVNQNNELSSIMKQLIEFPSKTSIEVISNKNQKVSIFSVLERVSNSEGIYFKLINAKVQEICNTSTVAGKLSNDSFESYDAILNVCNQMWQKQEDLKRKRQAEEDSLYVTKTKCLEEDEETVKLREIHEIFPNYAEEDFNEFLQNDTLEQIIKPDKEAKKVSDIIAKDDYKIIGDYFMRLMDGKVGDDQDYLKVFEDKLRVFHPIFGEFKTCLDDSIDGSAYRSLSLLVALCQESYDDLQLKEPSTKDYNFYKDSNITEAIACVDVMTKLEQRVFVELEQWPEHAVLNDLIRIIKRIRDFPSNSPLARFNSGLQILRQKVDEWNSVAHKLNNFKDIEFEIAEMIQKLMRMELQCWRESLNQSMENVRGRAYRYWFFLYNLIHEFLSETIESDKESSLVDFTDVEKRFASDDVIEEKPTSGKISVEAITKVLRQFIEASSYAEFSLRMKLIKSFENYLVKSNSIVKNSSKTKLIAILHNLHLYFTQFAEQVQDQIEFVRKPVEKKLKDAVKIHSFNKDLSYFSMSADIKKVHRGLHKILKEFEVEVMKKISDLFQYKDSNGEFNSFKAPSSVWKPTDVNLEAFVASQELMPSPALAEESSLEVLQNIDKYFMKSRKIVRESIGNAQYPMLIELFQEMMEKELDTVTHLRCLEVNRDQPRNKQKSQAKHILTQKRKALTDFFKSLTLMGVSYRTGLLTYSINPELDDLQVVPFSVDSITIDDLQVRNRVQIVNQKLDLYFNKAVFKMKLLSNALLMPRPDMDHGFLERMKGFSIDFFMLVQEQRKGLSLNVSDISLLKKFICDLEIVKSAETETINFETEFKKAAIIEESLVKVVEILEQFKILMKCAPESTESHHKVINSTNNTFHQTSYLYTKIKSLTDDILAEVKVAVTKIAKSDSRFKTEVGKQVAKFTIICNKLGELKEYFVVDKEYSVYGESICHLHSMMKEKLATFETLNAPTTELTADIDEQLNDVANTILIAMQNIFKKFQSTDEAKESSDNEETNLVANHLKEKMHNEIVADFNVLNLHKVNLKLLKILDSVFLSTNQRTKLIRILPLVKQFDLLANYFFVQQLSAHKLSTKMLSIMLSVFLELATKGFCVPQDLLSDEEQKEENDTKTGEGFGFEDGEGEKDVSDKLESEDQLDEAKKPEDYNNKDDQQEKDLKEEKGIDMSEDFEGKMQDVDKNDDSDSDAASDENEEIDKEMGETEEGADKLDDQIWGSDEENEPEEQEDEKNEETGKGSGEKDDKHNDMDTDKNQTDGQEEDGLDAADSNENKKQEQKKDIEEMNEQGEEEDQVNPFHNELEEPPQPEDLNLDEDMNLDNEDKEGKENPEENPFDIDSMKENMETTDEQLEDEEAEGEKDQEPEKKEDAADPEDSEDEQNETEKPDPDQENNEENQEPDAGSNEESAAQVPDTVPEDEKTEEKQQNTSNDAHESKDKKSKEENVQSMPNQQQQGSHDDVEVEATDEAAKQETEIDEQDTGEDRDGVGQAENEESKSGHQGIADTKETKSRKNQQKNQQQQKRKMGNTDEDRTLGEVDKMEKKTLKTVDKLNRQENPDSDQEMDDQDAEEHQHVKDAKKTDKTTLDNATEEQSKKIQHDERSKLDEDDPMEGSDELMEEDKPDPDMLDKKPEELESKKLENKSDKPGRNDDKTNERLEQAEEVQIDGEDVTTFNVPRGDETTAHCQMEIVNDASIPEEQTTSELFAMRKLVETEVTSQNVVNPDATDMERWQEVSSRMMPNARDLCEQLRLILEPTKCTRLKGDYRTGRRINMKKIIPYIASQFRKDKIWLRRTKPAQRDYKITIAVDDSKSMDHNNSKNLTLQAISLVSQALTLLESGKLCVLSFGESPKIILKYNDQFNGPKMVKSLNFDQNKSRIAELLDFSRTLNQEDPSSENGIFEHLLIVLSDGRNIFSEGEQRVKNAVKQARLQRMFIVYIIIDNPENKYSILDIRAPQFSADKKTITSMLPYLDTFPFPYYVIVRDLNQLPLVLSDGLRQWFELVNSEQ